MVKAPCRREFRLRGVFWRRGEGQRQGASWRCREGGLPRGIWLLAIVVAAGLTMQVLGAGSAVHAQVPVAEDGDSGPARRVALRFITESDYPPFNFLDEDGQLTGFNVDLARSICLEAGIPCDIKTVRWDDLFATLNRGEADGIIAGHAVSATALREVDFTTSYLHTPGRFAVRRDAEQRDVTPSGLDGQRVGVVKGTAHEAYLQSFFKDSRIVAFASPELAREALAGGQVGYLFGDAISLSFWLNGTLSRQCCEFRGGPFLEPRFFGDGVAVAVRRGDREARTLIDDALTRLRQSGRLEELVGRYFPYRVY